MGEEFKFSGAGEFDGGENQDVCSFFASFINQRQSVERLLNWLRESQTTCTDTHCFDDINGLSLGEHGSMVENSDEYNDSYSFSLFLWLAVGFLTIVAMNYTRDHNRLDGEQMQGKQNKSLDKGNQDRSRRNDDDDHNSPSV